MLNKIVKPFGATVEASFRRIEVMSNMLKFFPPPGSRGKMTTKRQWNAFQVYKKVLPTTKREMKYNLLPDVFHDRFDELEVDWTEMNNSKFLSEAQKCESIDTKERLKQTKARETLKRKKGTDGDSVANLNRTQKDKKILARSKNRITSQQVVSRHVFVNCAKRQVRQSLYIKHIMQVIAEKKKIT